MNRRDFEEPRRKAVKADADSFNDPDMQLELRRLAESYREGDDEDADRCALDSGALAPDLGWR